MKTKILTPEGEDIGRIVVNSAFKLHNFLGPGLLEKVYEVCLAHELQKSRLHVQRQLDVPIQYDGLQFKEGLRLDLLIENKVVVEIKAIETVNPVWQAQILSHLKLTNLNLGYLINFNVPLIKDGIRRFIN